VNGRNFESLKSITVAGQNVDINNITVFNSETLQFILPAITITEGQDVVNGKIIVTTEFGTSGSSVNFTFNPELQNVTMSSPGGLANTSVTEVTSVSQQDRIGSDLNPQNIGAVPLVVSTETKSALGGNEILTITVNPEAGSWVIDDTPSFSYDYKVNQTQNNSNSTILTTTTYEGNNKTLEGYVSSDGQTFSIDREDFINSQFDIDREEFKDVSLRINTMIYLRATPLDKEKNPKNFERQYPFEIVIPPSAPPNPARIIEVSNVNDFNLPSLRGQNFYNIEKPNGGYITFEFVCENVIVKQSPKVFSIPQNIEQAITVQNSGNTKYTNLITLRSLGQFQLGIPFEVSQYPGITFTARSQIFIL
jgi:hypothetical protein